MGLLGKIVETVGTGGLNQFYEGGSALGNSGWSSGGIADFIPGVGDARAQERANKINIEQAQLNRDFQERMSSTAYQRAMEDMKKAGLNPMLAYMQGGASAPSGSQATVESASKTGLFDKALQGYTGISAALDRSTGLQQQQSMNESSIQLQAANAAKAAAETEKIRSETRGLKRKASEGDLWDKFYKGVNKVLDGTAKAYAGRQKSVADRLIKPLGPASKKESQMFNWLQGKKKPN